MSLSLRHAPSLILILACVAAGCQSSATVTTGPTPIKCAVTLALSDPNIDSAGGTSVVNVTAQPECSWTAASEVSWISGLAPASGQGNGQISFRVNANPAALPRQGDIVVNDGRVHVQQSPAACRFELSSAGPLAPASGGVHTVTVTTSEGCAWNAASSAPWITITAGGGGSGSGTVTLSIAPNFAGERAGNLSIGDQTWTVTQAGSTAAQCGFSLTPPTQSLPSAAGPGTSIAVGTSPECDWTAATRDSWITLLASSGRGPGSITFRVTANAGSTRTGFIFVGDNEVAVTQTGVPSCSASIAPATQAIDAAGGAGTTITVSSPAACGWTATSGVAWITITGAATGVGNGTVSFSVDVNTGAARTGTLSIGGQVLTVNQAAAPAPSCSYTIAPTAHSLGAGGGPAPPVAVTTAAGCAWTASTSASWIGITSGSGTGSGSLTYTVTPNTGPTRSDTISIAGQTLTVSQSAPGSGGGPSCAYSVDATPQSIGAAGGTGTTVAVTTTSGCAWSATSNVPWIVITAGASGNGAGSVAFRVDQNPGAARSGILTIAGTVVPIAQAAAGAAACTYTVDSAPQSIGAAGGPGTSIGVQTASGCTWSAASSVPWIGITSGAAGSGTGSVAFHVDANTGAARTGNITIAGTTVSITQAAASSAACTYSIDSAPQSIGAAGGAGTSIGVRTASGCTWSAASSVPWIGITSGGSGNGTGSVAFHVDANTGAARAGNITIAGTTVPITQAAASAAACTYTIDSAPQSIGAAGGAGTSIGVQTASACTWSATSSVPWIDITSGASGSGSGAVAFRVDANTGAARTGSITIAGTTVPISQAGGCSYAVDSSPQSIGAAGGAGNSIGVTTASGCTWSATSNVPWIGITSGASGNGNGSVAFRVDANTGAPRAGSITIAGTTVPIAQAGGCTYTIDSTSQSIGAAGGAGSPVGVTAASGCTWSASSNVPWIAITGGASGNGSGTLSFRVDANTGAARSGSIAIADKALTVLQAGGCTFAIGSTSQSIPATGGDGTPVTVTTASGCSWTAATSTSWITISSGASGTGPGSVAFRVAANTGSARVGTLTIAGQTFTVSQGSGCSYSINPSSVSVGVGGGAAGPIAVSTATDCSWSAASNASWITVTGSANGSGNGSVALNVAANTGAARSGTVTIAGQTLTVSQPSACSYAISQTTMSIDRRPGNYSVSVTAPAGCGWSASVTSGQAWLSIESGSSGSGNGTVMFRADNNNNDSSRTGTISIAGLTLTVTQAGR
jgi:hypothetical protein